MEVVIIESILDSFVKTKKIRSKLSIKVVYLRVFHGNNNKKLFLWRISMYLKDSDEINNEVAMQKGREEGIVANRIENAGNLLDLLSDDVIADRIGLSDAEVRKIREQKEK